MPASGADVPFGSPGFIGGAHLSGSLGDVDGDGDLDGIDVIGGFIWRENTAGDASSWTSLKADINLSPPALGTHWGERPGAGTERGPTA